MTDRNEKTLNELLAEERLNATTKAPVSQEQIDEEVRRTEGGWKEKNALSNERLELEFENFLRGKKAKLN